MMGGLQSAPGAPSASSSVLFVSETAITRPGSSAHVRCHSSVLLSGLLSKLVSLAGVRSSVEIIRRQLGLCWAMSRATTLQYTSTDLRSGVPLSQLDAESWRIVLCRTGADLWFLGPQSMNRAFALGLNLAFVCPGAARDVIGVVRSADPMAFERQLASARHVMSDHPLSLVVMPPLGRESQLTEV